MRAMEERRIAVVRCAEGLESPSMAPSGPFAPPTPEGPAEPFGYRAIRRPLAEIAPSRFSLRDRLLTAWDALGSARVDPETLADLVLVLIATVPDDTGPSRLPAPALEA